MSEYQCYEFLALERPLTEKQQTELRAISTRAKISPTRFWNEYQWGDLKADSAKLVARYFDAHRYFANWGTHRLMLRVPKARVDAKALEHCFVGGQAACLSRVGDHVVLDLCSDTEEPEDDEEPCSLASLSPLRAELMRGDLRPAYLAWLLAAQAGEVADDEPEPAVPAGLAELTAAQDAMVEFLRIDLDLVAAAALGSAATSNEGDPFRQWLVGLSAKEKDAWLARAANEPDLAVGSELLRVFRAGAKGAGTGHRVRRTAGALWALAETQRAARELAEAAREKKAKAAAEARRQVRLTKLGRDVDAAWTKLEKLVASKSYDEAVRLAVDLRDLATREGTAAAFARRFEAMRKRQVRRRGFYDRWKYGTEASSGW